MEFQDVRHGSHLSRKAAAEYLGVDISTVNRWDNGKSKPPFAVLALLRVIGGELPELSLHKHFNGWRFADTYIITPNGEKFTPHDIQEIRHTREQAAAYRSEILQLQREVKRLTPDGQAIGDSNIIKFPAKRA